MKTESTQEGKKKSVQLQAPRASAFSAIILVTRITPKPMNSHAVIPKSTSNQQHETLLFLFSCQTSPLVYASNFFPFFCSTFNKSARLICGSTPPNAIVARISVSSSSSPRIASCKWRGVMRLTFRSLAALPANSNTSAVRYSSTAVR